MTHRLARAPQIFLVTGAAGFIGSAFVREACALGHTVVGYDLLTYAGHRENLSEFLADRPTPGKCTLIVKSITDLDAVRGAIGECQPDALINFAAESHVDRSIEGPRAFIDTNIIGTFTLLQASLEYFQKNKRFRYLQVSTDEVYGQLGENGHFSETSPYQPNSPYSASKAAADHLVRAWHHTYGLPTLTTNCSNNYGPRQFPEKLIPTVITRAIEGLSIPVYGEGKNIRDWIQVEDHVRGILLALESGAPGQTYCFGGRAERRNIDVVESLCKLLDELHPSASGKSYRSQIEFVTDRLGHDWRYAIDDTKSERDLGFTRKYSFESGLRQTVEWYLSNAAWIKSVREKRSS